MLSLTLGTEYISSHTKAKCLKILQKGVQLPSEHNLRGVGAASEVQPIVNTYVNTTIIPMGTMTITCVLQLRVRTLVIICAKATTKSYKTAVSTR